MIISEFLKEGTNKKCRPRIFQIRCDNCSKEYNIDYTNQKRGFIKYHKDLCQSCKQLEQYKSGERSKEQCYKGGEESRKKMAGKKISELYSSEKCSEIQHKCSFPQEKNPMYGKNYQSYGLIKYGKDRLGKSNEEFFGKEKSNQIKLKLSLATSGKNNPMYGKPTPMGSGNGWSGWYKEWYFRSLLELSYMINVIERFHLEWKSAETSDLKIKYKGFNGIEKTYVADFIINEKYLVEIKPKKLHNSKIVQIKKNAAEDFCKERNFIYKLTYPPKLLSFEEIEILLSSNKLRFIDRYQEKYNSLKMNNL